MSAGSRDLFLVKPDASGKHVLGKVFGDASEQRAGGLAIDAVGSIVLTGSTAAKIDFGGGPLLGSGADAFVAKLGPMGNHVWSQLYGDAAPQVATAVAIDPAGHPIVIGEVFGSIVFDGVTLASVGQQDVFVVKMQP